MNTPSKEALDAGSAIVRSLGITDEDRDLLATIIDRHFEPLRRDNAALAGRLTAAELERDDLGARAEQAEARVAELAGALRSAVNELERQTTYSDGMPSVSHNLKYNLRAVLARHAAGEPAKHPEATQ